jgi:hypothetical protein
MDDTRWERYGALGGIVFVVLVVASIIVTGGNATATDSASKIVKYFSDHQDGIKVAAFLSVLASVPIIVWAGSLWPRLHRAGDRHNRLALIAVLGLLIGGVGNLTQNAVNAGVALELHLISPNGVKFYFVLSQAFGAGGLVGLAVLVFAVSAAAFRLGAFPRWIGWLGVVDGIVFLVASYSIATTNDGIGALGLIGFVLWAIWLVATSVVMYRVHDEIPATA